LPLGLVHRDVSPGNILISFDGIVKLIDFGIAFARGRNTETESGVVKGKLDYMAPEQLRRKKADRRVDIFSVGVVLYQLATGRHPFLGEDEGERLEKQLACVPVPPLELLPHMDPRLAQTILKALSREPAQRQQTAEELGTELRELLAAEGGLVDQQVIADVMSRLFAGEIAADSETFEKAMEMQPAHESHISPVGNRVTGDDHAAPQWASRQEPEAPAPEHVPATEVILPAFESPKKTVESPGLSTEVIDPTLERPGRATRYRRGVLALVVAATCLVLALVLILMNGFFEQKNQEEGTGDSRPADSVAAMGPENRPASKAETISKPNETPARAKPPGRSVKIRLIGLPRRATVMLDGKDVAVVAGRVTVPVDGARRELQVRAKGYRTYLRKISPSADGEMTVKLEKRGARPRKRVHTKEKKPVNEPKNRLQACPYCDS